MKKKLLTVFVSLGLLSLAITPALAGLNFGLGDVNNAATQAGFTQTDLGVMVGKIVQAVLSMLGLIALILVIVAGFQWMTSGGNEEKISGAKKLMSAGIIGLVIVLIAWAATTYVLSRLQTVA